MEFNETIKVVQQKSIKAKAIGIDNFKNNGNSKQLLSLVLEYLKNKENKKNE